VRTIRIFVASAICAGVLCLGGAGRTFDIRQFDFKNSKYPWIETGWTDHLKWLSSGESSEVTLVKGRWAMPGEDSEEVPDPYGRFTGLTFESVSFGDLTGDGRDDAIVALRFDTGGTQYSHYVYIYTLAGSSTKLLGYFHTGDRAYSGLYQVYAEGGKFVVELFDREKREGDCCSSGFIRTRYLWQKGKFDRVGPEEFGTPKTVSPLPVSTFGIHPM
jgi:hypothetical protein